MSDNVRVVDGITYRRLSRRFESRDAAVQHVKLVRARGYLAFNRGTYVYAAPMRDRTASAPIGRE